MKKYTSLFFWLFFTQFAFSQFDYDLNADSTYFRSGTGWIYNNGLSYYMIPSSQIAPIQFSGKVTNIGNLLFTGLHLNTVIEMGANTATVVSSNIDLMSGMSDSLFSATTYTPSWGLGLYTITSSFEGDFADEAPANNTTVDSFEITESIYAVDNGIQQSSFTNVVSNLNSPIQIGNIMEIFGDGYIDAISVKIDANPASVNRLVFCVLYKYNSSTGDFEFMNQTADHLVQNSDLNNFIELPLSTAATVDAGDLILVCAGHYGEPQEVHIELAQPAEEGTVLGFIDGGATIFMLTAPKAIMVRPNIVTYTTIHNTIEICDGESITVGTSTYSTSAVYEDFFAATVGDDSLVVTHLTVVFPYTINQTIPICAGGQVVVGTSIYTSAGTYIDSLLTVNSGCDSVVHTTVTILPPIDLSITALTYELTSNATGVSYQWVDCDNGNSPIVGATNQSFQSGAIGNYAVIIDNGSCTEMSACYPITALGITHNSEFQVNIFPNPSPGIFNLSGLPSNAEVEVLNFLGEAVWKAHATGETILDISHLASGIYHVRIYCDNVYFVDKLIKQ